MQVERVDYITIPTRDEERSRAWYREMIGLQVDLNNAAELTAGEFVGEGDTGVCRMAVCSDPDGNAVILHRRYKPYE